MEHSRKTHIDVMPSLQMKKRNAIRWLVLQALTFDSTADGFAGLIRINPASSIAFLCPPRQYGPSARKAFNARRRCIPPKSRIFYSNDETIVPADISSARERFTKTADTKPSLDQPCIITIDNARYNVTAWGKCSNHFKSSLGNYFHLA